MRFEHGGRLVRRTPHRQRDGVGDVIPISPAHGIPRRRQRGRRISQQGTRRVKTTREKRRPTGDRGAEQLGCPRHLGTLLVHALCHFESIRHLARQQQRADVRVGDVESHVRGVEEPRRYGVSRVRDGHRFGGLPRVRKHHGKHPCGLGARDGRQIFQHKAFRCLYRLLRLVQRKPVHGEEGVDPDARRDCYARRHR